jgi:hypothetical protein
VVVEGDRLIAADRDGHKAFATAKATGIEVKALFEEAKKQAYLKEV